MSEWKKVKIGDICKIVKGTTGIASAESGQYPLVVTAEERKTCSTYQFDCEAVCIPLVSSSGHGKKSLKNVHYQSGKFALGTILCAVIPNNPQELDARYLHQYLQFYKDIILVPLMKGAANVSLSMKDIATVEFPLPPIERQRELSNLFFSLQEKQKELSAEYEKQTKYAKLLRQNILQEAIEGKLTADWRNQNPVQKGNSDYDAEALFEKIQKEQNNDKKQKELSQITDEEKPFEIPEGWKWIRLGEICDVRDGTHDTPAYIDRGYPLITGKDFYNVFFKLDKTQFISQQDYENIIKRSLVEVEDILFSMIGGNIGSMIQITTDNYFEMAIKNVALFKKNEIICQRWIFWLIQQNVNFFQDSARDGAQPFVSLSFLRNFLCALPSLREQKEIVNRVEKLLTKVTTLENQIQDRKSLSDKLIFGIIKENLEG